jgi:hypothetical protein
MENKRNGWYTDKDGTRRHYHNGKRHREDGPAVIYPNGYQSWWINGLLHREDGPAIVCSTGTLFWILNGERVDMEAVLDTPEKMEAYLLEESLRRL